MKRSFILPVVLGLAAATGVSACAGEGGGGDSNEIVIGVSEPLTGVGAAAGGGIVDAIEMAADEINAAGGIDGKTIKVEVLDNATDPAQCTTTAQKIVSSPAVAMIGGWSSSCTLAMIPVTTRAELPLVVETSSSPAITDPEESGSEWVFRMSPPSTMDTVAVGQFVEQLDIKKVFMLAENTDFGLGANEAYQAMFAKAGVDVTGSETFAQTAQTFRDQVTKAIAAGADTWAVTTEVEQLAQILREARGQGGKAQVLASGGSASPSHVIELAGPETAEGLLATEYFPEFDPSLAGDPAAAEAFSKNWVEAGHDVNVISEAARGYAALYVIADALKQADDPTSRASVRDALEKVDVASIIYGRVKFEDWCGLINQNQPTITLTRVHNGAVELAGKAVPPYDCPAE
ncbi:ABC transporter substrate-binding protein [Mycolicibacterium sp.]|uniref:ABC transporter substrate-binding protein n=1 Tax=Mycolicibacterium sp. TaxID=2320850 RepID=UPI003D123FBF